MTVESAADRAVFLNPDEFGATAIYTPHGGPASDPIAGQFDRPNRSASLADLVDTIDARPTFLCRQADLPAAADGNADDLLAVAGAAIYRVTSIEPDGTGMVLLGLGAAS